VLVIEAARLDERMKLAKILTQKTLAVEVGLGEDPEQRQSAAVLMAESFAKTIGVQFEKGAAADLAERVSADLMRLKTEIEKLANYLGERKKITPMEFLDRLLRDGEAPLEMLGALTWMYRKLIEASEIRGAMNGWQAARTLGMRPEQADIALRAARKTSKAQLLAGLRALEKADDRLKSSKDSRMVLEFLVTELTSANALSASR
jgi:DNA polymerase III delta subunit